MKESSLALICIREDIEGCQIENFEFEGTLPELLKSLIDLLHEEYDLVYVVENWQTLEFLDAVEKIRSIDIDLIRETNSYDTVFGNLEFIEAERRPPRIIQSGVLQPMETITIK